MVKKIFDTYGYEGASVEDLAHIIEDVVGVELRACEGLYAGETYRYNGGFSDEIVIGNSTEYDQSVYPILVRVSNTYGKNADNISKSKYIKQRMLLIPKMHLISQDIIETVN